ncbi:MAG TPA: histidinol-phosphate transaminase [Acidimicrobiales bacterium]|nr:histidinol-phosphate transaminase [Acidimicrobiales bacterium]
MTSSASSHASSSSSSSSSWSSPSVRRPLAPLREDLAERTGYHSPQVEVEVRLNTNESPFPPPDPWRARLQEEIARLAFNRYPDREYRQLRTALARSHGVTAQEVFCAKGSNEVLQCLLLAFGGTGRTVALFEPTYALHRHIAELTATNVASDWRGRDFRLEAGVVDRVVAKAQPVVTFLCSPNNPTGLAEPPELIVHVLERAAGLVVVDEAYGQFAAHSALALRAARVPGWERLVVVRTFSKTWSMAACRLGYLVADPEVVAACGLTALPYHLDAITQAAGRLALEYEDDMRARVASLVEERGRIGAAMAELPLESWPSEANFILFRPTHKDAASVWQDLLDQSVLVRDCSGWPGLDGCLRVTVGTPQENGRFLAALSGSLGEGR